jgi:hypothetical protein
LFSEHFDLSSKKRRKKEEAGENSSTWFLLAVIPAKAFPQRLKAIIKSGKVNNPTKESRVHL